MGRFNERFVTIIICSLIFDNAFEKLEIFSHVHHYELILFIDMSRYCNPVFTFFVIQ